MDHASRSFSYNDSLLARVRASENEAVGRRERSALSIAEKISLWMLAVFLVIPYPFFDGIAFSFEIAIALFVIAGHQKVSGWGPVFIVMGIFGLSSAFAFFFPPFSYSLVISGLVFLKLCMYLAFILILVKRCSARNNLLWVAKNLVLPVGVVLCGSAVIDSFVSTGFFVNWHVNFTVHSNSGLGELFPQYGADPDLLAASIPGSGLATRLSDIPSWALLGFASAYVLRQDKQLSRIVFLACTAVLIVAPFAVPKRSALAIFGLAALAFILAARSRADRRWKVAIFLLIFIAAPTIYVVGQRYEPTYYGAEAPTALGRFYEKGIGDDRFVNLPHEIGFLISNPRELILGAGWIFGAGYWSKPHNSYIGLLVGGGIFSLTALIVWIRSLMRRGPAEKRAGPRGTLGLVLLACLVLGLAIDGYFFSKLEFPAATAAIWLALGVAFHRNPQPSATSAS